MNLIETQSLNFSYQSQPGTVGVSVLCDINLEITSGSFVGILGANGSGKSTLAKTMNGLLLPSGGKVYIEGMDTVDEQFLLEIRRRVGLVFQNPDNQIVSNIVEDDVAFAPENLGIPPEEIRQRVDEALRAVDMYDYRNHAPHLLSGGQKQRVAIAGIIAMRPKCIVLDEPTAMLDPVGRREVLGTIKTLARSHGLTVILITHHMSECVDADRLIVMAAGEIALDGTPQEVFAECERLEELGLAPPQTVALLFELRKRGLALPLDAITVEDCAKAIVSAC